MTDKPTTELMDDPELAPESPPLSWSMWMRENS